VGHAGDRVWYFFHKCRQCGHPIKLGIDPSNGENKTRAGRGVGSEMTCPECGDTHWYQSGELRSAPDE